MGLIRNQYETDTEPTRQVLTNTKLLCVHMGPTRTRHVEYWPNILGAASSSKFSIMGIQVFQHFCPNSHPIHTQYWLDTDPILTRYSLIQNCYVFIRADLSSLPKTSIMGIYVFQSFCPQYVSDTYSISWVLTRYKTDIHLIGPTCSHHRNSQLWEFRCFSHFAPNTCLILVWYGSDTHPIRIRFASDTH